jgi:hypothetical protein
VLVEYVLLRGCLRLYILSLFEDENGKVDRALFDELRRLVATANSTLIERR